MSETNPGKTPDIKSAQLKEQPTAVVRETVPMNALREFFGRAFEAVMAAVQQQHVQLAGPPFALYRGKPTDVVDVEAGFPLAAPFTNLAGADTAVIAGTLPAGRAYEAMHMGSYEKLHRRTARSWRGCGRTARARGRQCGSTTSPIPAPNPTRRNGRHSSSGRWPEVPPELPPNASSSGAAGPAGPLSRISAARPTQLSVWPHYSSTPCIMS